MPRSARAVLAPLVLGVVTLLPASARADVTAVQSPIPTSCTVKLGQPASVRRAARGTDAVFAAKVLHTTQLRGGRGDSAWQLHVRVTAGFRGAARKGGPADIQLAGSVRRVPAEGSTYLFFVRQEAGGFVAEACGGVQRLAKGVTSTLRHQMAAALASGNDTAPPEVDFGPVNGSAHDLPALGRLVAPGAGLALLGVLGLILFRRLGREQH